MTIRQNIQIRQGETWSYVYTWLDGSGNPVDLTGYTACMSIKRDYDSGLGAYFSTGSDADGGTIVLGGALGTVTLSMTATQSAALAGSTLDEQPVEMIYDCEVVSSAGVVMRILEGKAVIYREVTT